MKKFWILIVLMNAVCVLACKKDDPSVPVVVFLTTTPITNITLTTATSGGKIDSDGGKPITERGVCWSTVTLPTVDLATKSSDGSGTGDFTSTLTGLSLGGWFARAYAVNSAGVFYGNEISFQVTPPSPLPVLTTAEESNVTAAGVSSGGTITAQGDSPVTARGVCWSTSHNPTIALGTKTSDGSGPGPFASAITGLTTWTTYYVRAYATNAVGTSYGNEIIAVPIPPVVFGSVTDIDGNSYKTVVIGSQTWMAENLKTTRYQNGATLQTAGSTSAWASLTAGAYINFDNSASNGTTYGHLYNGYAVADPNNVCPSGWHVATVSDWTLLGSVLGGFGVAGGRMKETGTAFWSSPNTGASNTSGFSSRAGGSIHNGNSVDMGTDGYWWSSSSGTFYYNTNDVSTLRTKGASPMNEGLSVRCVKD